MGLFDRKKELVVVEKQEVVPAVTEQTVTDYMKAFGLVGNLQDNEVEAFKQMAVMHNLNPFNREIYCSAYGSGQYRTLSIVTGYEVYIRKAEQSELLEYWTVEEAPPETPIENYYATLIIKRKDKAKEQRWTTHYSEAVQKKKDGSVNSFWKKQPRMMTKKVAMSQGFRLFFEDVMHGIPYTREEMPESKGGMTDVTPQPLAEPITYTELKEAPGATIVEEKDNQPKEEPIDVPESSQGSPEGVFKEIMAIVNGKTLTSQQKMETIKKVMPVKGNLAELKKILEEL